MLASVTLIRRSGLSIALLLGGIVVMPLVVLWFSRHPPGEALATATLSRSGNATPDPADAAIAAAPAGLVTRIVGVRPGATLTGTVAVSVEFSGDPGAVSYLLNGPQRLSFTSYSPPFVLEPDATGWDTTRLPDGNYILYAAPTDRIGASVSVSFRIRNALTSASLPSVSGPSTAASGQ